MSGIARTGRFSDYTVTPWLNQFTSGPVYVSLFTADPYGVSNPTTVEVSGAAYARQLATMSLSGRLLSNVNAFSFVSLPVGTSLFSIGAFDAAFNGNMLWASPLPNAPISYPNGGYLSVNAGQYLVGIDA